MGWMWNNLRVQIPGSYPVLGILVRIPFRRNRLPIPRISSRPRHNSMGSNPNRRCISMEEYRPVEPVIRVRFPAAAPKFLAFHVHRGHAAQRPPGLGNAKQKTRGLEGIEPPSRGPKPGIIPVDHNPTGDGRPPPKTGYEPELTQGCYRAGYEPGSRRSVVCHPRRPAVLQYRGHDQPWCKHQRAGTAQT